jgi:hypothetical protein
MKKLLTVVVATVACVAASAQTANFEGFSGALNLNRFSSGTKVTNNNNNNFYINYGGQSWNGSIQAAYGFSLNTSSVVSFGATYTFGSIDGGGEDLGQGISNFRAKNASSLYVEPGFLVSEKTLVYGKLSYESAKGSGAFLDTPEYSKTIKGAGFGIGVRTMIDKKTFIQVEFKEVSYGTVDMGNGDRYKPKSIGGTVGFGVKF